MGPGLNGKSINKQVSTSRPRVDSVYSTLPETNSSPRKIKSWKIYFLWDGVFSDAVLVSEGVIYLHL